MHLTTPSPSQAISHAWNTLVHEIVDIVPENMACCEFDCSKPECSYSKWATCERRLAYVRNQHTASTPAQSQADDD